MTPSARKEKEYIIMDKETGHILHEGSDRRSILPNDADSKTQQIISIGAFVIITLIGVVGYCGDNAYRGITSSLSDIKASQQAGIEKIWNIMSIRKANRDNQFQWIEQECCADAKTSPPTITPQ